MAGASCKTHERECAVCTNDFTTPKILPCGHLLCRQCVITWMDSKHEAGCPLCKYPIAETQDKLDGNSADIADALPADYVMETLVDTAHVLDKEHNCCVCDDAKADFICMQCLDMMCSSCYKIHNKFSATRSHYVVRLSTVTVERLAASRPALCADHGDRQAEAFCTDHGIAVCKSCKYKNHRECSNVNNLDFEIKSAQHSLGKCTKILEQTEQKLEQAIGQLTSRLHEISKNEDDDMAHVDKTCERLRKLVDDFRDKLKENICTSHLKLWNSSHDLRTELSEWLGRVVSHKQIVSRAKAVAPTAAVIQARNVLRKRVNSLKLSADLEQKAWTTPLTSTRGCEDVAMQIEEGLQILTQQISKTKLQMDEGTWCDEDAAASVYFGVTIQLPSVGHVHLEDIVLHSWRKVITKAKTAGLMIDSSNHLHFYLDGQEVATEIEAVPQPCYAVFQFKRCGEASVGSM